MQPHSSSKCLYSDKIKKKLNKKQRSQREVVTNPLLRCSLFNPFLTLFFFSFYDQNFYLTVVNVQLPLIILGHSYRAFTKLLALGTQKEEDEQYRMSTTGLQRARSRGQRHGQTDFY